MKAQETILLNLIKNASPGFTIPIYQRFYSWKQAECSELWEDILRAGLDEKNNTHFLGSIVYVQDGIYSATAKSHLVVIDGQQRLTTIILLLIALSELLDEKQEIIEDFSKNKLKDWYLINHLEKDDKKYRLILSETDKDTLIALIEKRELPKEYSIRINENYIFFKNKLEQHKHQLEIICKGIEKLSVVDISLDRDHDNPQLIFESMNSTGKDLTQTDLIRNYILMGVDHKTQLTLYQSYWRPMELDFGQEGYQDYFDAFMRYYLAIKTKEFPKINHIYEAFKKYHKEKRSNIESLIADIRVYSQYFCKIALDQEENKKLSCAFKDFKELQVDVAYPLLLQLYDDYRKKCLPIEDFEKAVRLIESYIIRRSICGIPTNGLNKVFLNFANSIEKDKYLESFQAKLILAPHQQRLPKDEEFQKEFISRNFYDFRNSKYCLERLENFGRKEKINVNNYTIEHIMPKNEKLSQEWQNDLGANWKDIQKNWLHTLGNLTLTGYNSEYSDKPFKEKRDLEGGFAKSPLKLNEYLRDINIWNKEAIINRANILSDQAIKIWIYPKLEESVLEKYKK